jgi:hypothetical protein
MSNKTKIAIAFWVHFAIATASHVFVVLMVGGVFKLALSTGILDFWIKGLILGITFYTAMYAINHVSNSAGFCVVTDIENFYRKKEGLPQVGPFTPRYYAKLRVIWYNIQYMFTRKPRKGRDE